MKKKQIILSVLSILAIGLFSISLTYCVPENRTRRGIKVQELNINDNIYVVHSRLSTNGNKSYAHIQIPPKTELLLITVTLNNDDAIEQHEYRQKVYKQMKSNSVLAKFNQVSSIVDIATNVVELVDIPAGDADGTILFLNDYNLFMQDSVDCDNYKAINLFKPKYSLLGVKQGVISIPAKDLEMNNFYLGFINCNLASEFEVNIAAVAYIDNSTKKETGNTNKKTNREK